jgi:quercetin dioxygenase-like cupin family protein
MRRLLTLVAALLLFATTGSAIAVAQDEGDDQVPEGATFELLTQAVVEELPAAPADIALVRLTFDPGVSEPIEAGDPSIALVSVESGSLTFGIAAAIRVTRVAVAGTPVAAEVQAAGVEFTLGPGDSALIPPLAPGVVRNDGTEPAVAVGLFLGPSTDEGMAEASTEVGATPAPEEETEGITFQPLAFGTADSLPAGPAFLAIVRLTAEPAVVFPPEEETGIEVIAIEAGSFTVQSTEGPPLQVARGLAAMDFAATPGAEPLFEEVGPGQEATVAAGDSLFIPTGNVNGATAGAETSAALFGVVESLGAAGATPEMATPAA